MAENTPGSQVALGRANTGSAFVLDQSTAERPRAIIQDAEAMRYARQQADAKAKEEQQAKAKKDFEGFMDDTGQASLIYKANDLKETEAFISAQAGLWRQYEEGKIDKNEMMRQGQINQYKIKSYKDATHQLEKSRLEVNEQLKDKRYNAVVIKDKLFGKYVDPTTGKVHLDPTKVPKFEETVKPELENPDNFDIGEVRKSFYDNLTEIAKSDEQVVSPRFLAKTATSTKLPFQRNADGSIAYNEFSGKPKLLANQALAEIADKDPFVKRIIDKQIEDQERSMDQAIASGDTTKMQQAKQNVQTRAQIAAKLLEEGNPFTYNRDLQERSYAPQPREKKEKPITSYSVGGQGTRTTVTLADSKGNPRTSNAYEYASSSIADQNGKQFNGEIKANSYAEINPKNGKGLVSRNTDNIKVTYQGLSYAFVNPKTGNRLFAPESIENEEQFYAWVKEKAKDPDYKSFTQFTPLIRATTIEDSKVDNDFVDGANNTASNDFFARKRGFSSPTKSKKDVYIPYSGQARLDAMVQTKGVIEPNDDLKKGQQKVQAIWDEARREANSGETTSNSTLQQLIKGAKVR